MAFSSNNAQQSPTNDSWKAQGFINLYLPSKDGGRVKLGVIPLKEANAREKVLLDWLIADPTNASKILEKLIMEFRTAEPKAGSGFDLG